MPHTSQTSRARALACLVVVAFAAFAAAEPPDAEVAAIQRQVAALRHVRDGLLKELRGRPPAAEPPVTVQMVFPKLLALHGGQDLTITLRRSGGTWVWAAGRANAADIVDASGLALRNVNGQRRLAGGLRVRLAPDSSGKPALSEDANVAVVVDAAIAGDELVGTFRTDGHRPVPVIPRFDYTSSDGGGLSVEQTVVSAGEGPLGGREVGAAWRSDLTPLPEEDIIRDSVEAIIKRAQGHHLNACELYRQIHACALALERNVDVGHALALTPEYRPVWPVPAAPAATGSPRTPALGDVDVIDRSLDGLPDSRLTGKPSPQEEKTIRKELALTLGRIRAHAETLRGLAERYRPGSIAGKIANGLDTCSDPQFGPWFGEEPLPGDDTRPNVLPDEMPADGPQEWRRVEGWRVLGPFPALYRGMDLATLPEVVPAFDGGFVPPRSLVGDGAGERDQSDGGAVLPESEDPDRKPTTAAAGHRFRPVRAGKSSRTAYPPTSFYGEAEVTSPADREVWIGVQAGNSGAMWANNELVWVAPPPTSLCGLEYAYRFPIRLRKGANRLMLRVDGHGGDVCVRVCVRGRPRTAEEAARQGTTRQTAYARLASATDGVRGWRGNWSGTYHDARPPLAWDTERKINVLWETPLGLSHATPVIVGEKLFVLEDPATLTCIDKNTGAVLWRQEADIAELLPHDAREKVLAMRLAMRKATERWNSLGKTPEERRKALIDQGMTGEEADAALKELSEAMRQRKAIQKEEGVLGPAWGDWTGHTFSTPVTDGKHIWFKSNTGVIACYDLAGKRRWMTRHDGTTGTSAHIPSPVLCGGKLIVMLGKSDLASPADYTRADSVLRAYDAETGKFLWKADTAVGVIAEVTGTPLPMRLTNGREAMDVVVTADGSVVRVDDGKILRMHLGTRERFGSPTLIGAGRVCITGGDRSQAFKSCYELIMEDRDHVGARLLWQTRHPGTLYDSGDYQLAHGGLISSFGSRLDVVDAETGAVVYRSAGIFWRRPGRCYSPLALAGRHLYVADLGNWFGMKKSSFHGGALSVLTAGRHPVVLARNRIGRFSAAPAFDQDRIYLRQWYSLLCVGTTGKEGSLFEAETVAKEVMATIFPGRPGTDAPMPVEGGKGGAKGRLLATRMPDAWVMVGPVAPAQAEAVRSHLRGCDLGAIAATDTRGQTTLNGVACRLEPIRHHYSAEEEYGIRSHIVSKVGREFLEREERVKAEGEPGAWTESVIMGESGFPGSVIVLRGGALPAGSTAWLVTAVQNGRRRVMRLDLDAPAARAWVAGREVRHGQLLDLPAGTIAILAEVRGDAKAADVRLAPRFWPSYGGRQDLADWLAGMEQRRPYLENAIKLCPESDVTRKAKGLLREAAAN